MRLLKCKLCKGEADIIGSEHSMHKKIKCHKCDFTNSSEENRSMPEVLIMRRKPSTD